MQALKGALAIIVLFLIIFIPWKIEHDRNRPCDTVWVGKSMMKPDCN